MITLAALALGGVTISLPARATVTGTEIFVGEVADVQGTDAAAVERVRGTSLGYAPAPGYGRILHRERIAAELARKLAGLELTVQGQSTCRVAPLVETVSAEALRQEAGQALRALFSDDDAHIVPANDLAALVVPKPRTSLVLRARLQERAPQAGAWTVPVGIVVDGEVYRTVWTNWTVELWERRQILRRVVRQGETLSASDFVVARVRVGTGRERHALSPEAIGHAVARRDLAAGSVVTERDVERLKILRRGDIVGLEVKRGAVTVRALAHALEDGRVGDRIRVVCERTGKELTVVVVSKELVELRIR